MITTRSSSSRLVLGLVACALLAGCGHKRPPVVSTTAGGGAGRTSGQGTGGGETRPLDEGGPDVRALDNENAAGMDFPSSSDPTIEGGGPLADVFFEFNSFTLSDVAKATLEKHAAWLKAHGAVKVTVEGHCDERGTVEYNLALGDKRARAALEHLASLGVPTGRLSAISLGKERPRDPGHDEAAWAKNRRAHFAVTR